MRVHRGLVGFVLAASVALSLTGPAGAAGPPFQRSTILVKFANPAKAAGIVRSLGDRPLGLTLNRVEVVGLDRGESVPKKVARYRALKEVVYAEPNFIARGQYTGAKLVAPNDPGYGSQWAWGPIRAVDGWSVYPGSYMTGNAATIAVVDTGVDSRHPDLADGRVLTALGANCMAPNGACSPGSTLDDNGHGTHVAGIAAAARRTTPSASPARRSARRSSRSRSWTRPRTAPTPRSRMGSSGRPSTALARST